MSQNRSHAREVIFRFALLCFATLGFALLCFAVLYLALLCFDLFCAHLPKIRLLCLRACYMCARYITGAGSAQAQADTDCAAPSLLEDDAGCAAPRLCKTMRAVHHCSFAASSGLLAFCARLYPKTKHAHCNKLFSIVSVSIVVASGKFWH